MAKSNIEISNTKAARGYSAKAIAIDSNNNVYVTGYSEGVAKDYATIKYSPDSNIPVWMRNTKEQVISRWTKGTKDLPSF